MNLISRIHPGLLVVASVCSLLSALPASAGLLDDLQDRFDPEEPAAELQNAIFVGNNWDGTIDVINGDTYEVIGRINGIPDYEERMAYLRTHPKEYVVFLGIRQLIGEGNDQYVDDMYSTNDGELLVVSRPSFADVVALDLDTGDIVWRFEVDGVRSDHMALSPDGTQVAVSASTGDVVHILDVYTGEELDKFPTGDSPHENLYSDDGRYIYHSSIGNVFTRFDGQVLKESAKGERRFLVYDTQDQVIVKDFDIKNKLEEAGLGDLSPSIRPMAHTSDFRYFYFQLSFLHGLIEFDMETETVTRLAELPNMIPTVALQKYVNDSAHHGLAMSGDDTSLCVAGTMDDYAAIVNRETFEYTLLEGLGQKAYWAVSDRTGENCLISWSETDQVSVINYASKTETHRIDVGNHPQRIREGMLKADWVTLY